MLDVDGVQRVDRVDDALHAMVVAVVGRGGAAVVAGVGDRVHDLVRRVEDGIAGQADIGGRKRRLLVADRQVSGRKQRLDLGEHRPEVEGETGRPPVDGGLIEDRGVQAGCRR